MTKVIYSGFFGKWSSIIEILKTKYKWNPKVFLQGKTT